MSDLAPGWDDVGAFAPHRRMEFVGVRVERTDASSERPVLLLRDPGSDRYLALWTNVIVASALASEQAGQPSPAIHPYDLLADLIGAFALRLSKAVVEASSDESGNAVLTLNGVAVRCRVGDAVALTMRTGAPLYATVELLDAEGMTVDPPP